MKKSIGIGGIIVALIVLTGCTKQQEVEETKTQPSVEIEAIKEEISCMNECQILWKEKAENEKKSVGMMRKECNDICNK